VRRYPALIGPSVLFLIVTGFFWKLLTKQYTWMDQPDMAYQVLPWYQVQSLAWHRGEFPLWDPHVWAGQPLLGQLQPGAAYPLNWPLFLAPLKGGHIQPVWMNVYYVLTHFLAALFCYWLCRDLERSRAAAILGGLAFALAGVVGSLGWPQMLNGAIWVPLILMFFLRSVHGDRRLTSAALCGTFLGVSFLSGHHQIPTFTTLMMVALWAVEIWRRRVRAVAPLAIFALFTMLISAFQVLPAYEYGVRSIRWVGSQNPVFWGQAVPYSVHQQNSLLPIGLLGFVLPNITGQDAFVGLAVLTLAAAGFLLAFRFAAVRMLAVIGACALLFALGGFSVFHGVAYLLVPLVEKARTPAMALVIVQFALAVLAAYGMDALRTASLSRWWMGALITLGVLPWPALAVAVSVRAEASREYERFAVLAIVALALAGILHAWKFRRISDRAAISMLFVTVLFELGTVTTANYRHREAPGGYLAELDSNRDIVEFLRKQPDFVRLEVDTKAVPYNIGDWDGIDQFRAYLGGMTSNIAPFEVDRLNGGTLAPMLFALNYYAGRAPLRPDQQEVFTGKSGLKLFRNPEAFPRIWSTHEVISVDNPALISRLKSADLRRQVLVRDGAVPKLDACGGPDDVRIVHRSDAGVVGEARMACRGIVIFSETFYPGWQAAVDGRPAQIHEAYGVLRGVVVDGGAHRIEMRYRPNRVYWGAFLTAAGFIAACAMAFTRKAGHRRAASSVSRGGN
jgi:hypothetical protein